jgi:uncharacterized protein (DUF302 family)
MSNRIHSLRKIAAAAVLAFALTAGISLAAPRGPVVQVQAKGSVEDVLSRLKKAVAGNGMMVMGELHQGKIMEMTGLKVQSETVFVGNPTVGKELFSSDPGVGIVVPVRINVFADAGGNTIVSYVPPSHLLGEFGNPKVIEVAKMLDGKLQNLVGMLGR